MDLTFLFWNMKNKDLSIVLSRMVIRYSVDIVIGAECEAFQRNIISSLNLTTGHHFHSPDGADRKTYLFTKLDKARIGTRFINHTNNRLTIYHLRLPPLPGILLATIHFPDMKNRDHDDQLGSATSLINDIKDEETRIGIERTIVVGDLNMNPFDAGMMAPQGFNAVMSKSIAERRTRVVDGKTYKFLYNPMWGHFGDRSDGPPGTFYYSSKPVSPFWNILDQVLLRPELMHNLTDLKILSSSDELDTLLTREGLPDGSLGSDHLPLLFKINL